MSHSWSTISWILCRFVVHESPAIDFSGGLIDGYLQSIGHRKDGSTNLPRTSHSTNTLPFNKSLSSSRKSHIFLSHPTIINSKSSERSENVLLYLILLHFLPALTSVSASCNADNCLHASDQVPCPQSPPVASTPHPLPHPSLHHAEEKFPDAVLRVL